MSREANIKSRGRVAMKRFQANIWFSEKWRSYPRVRYYEAEREKDVTTMVQKEFHNYTELLIMEVLARPQEAWNL